MAIEILPLEKPSRSLTTYGKGWQPPDPSRQRRVDHTTRTGARPRLKVLAIATAIRVQKPAKAMTEHRVGHISIRFLAIALF
jgi:hypothetical protein